MKRIEGRARTVKELLDGGKYTIDFYQREYAWQERQVRELVDDLAGKFLDFHEPDHERAQVEDYGHYFLGPIVISHKRNQKFIVDGQQRLTTLTLLLIHLHHMQARCDGAVDVSNLIFSEKYGRKSFNLDVPDRVDVMQALLEGRRNIPEDAPESVQNILARYENLTEHLPDDVRGESSPFFADWLLENVHLIEIEAYSDEDAYTIFETMNDRGLSLSLPEMLKGYVLANIRREEDQRTVNSMWKSHMQDFKTLGEEHDVDFFKNWLRARHAQSIRASKKGSENQDYERIGSEFHRWVRDHREVIGLEGSDSFVRFVKRDLDFYARHAIAIRRATEQVVEGWESVFYNEERGFTLQHQVILAALHPDDDADTVQRKVALVADYLDIWLARRVWNFRTMAYSSVRYTIFNLTRLVRDQEVAGLSAVLRAQLDEQEESFADQPRFGLHQQNYRQVRHMLARLTHWLDGQCGLASHFEDLVSQGKARQFEIEHIWADHHDRYREFFPHAADFETARNRIGGLLLIQRGLNQSLGDAIYEDKIDAYVTKGENQLARSLHPQAYLNNPSFRAVLDRTGLDFQSFAGFGPEEQAGRQELYIRLAEWVWNPSRLDLDGEKPPIPEPIAEIEDVDHEAAERPDRHEARLGFWTALLEVARDRQDLHDNISPSKYQWAGARKHGQWWNYSVKIAETKASLYIDGPEATENKTLFDSLHDEKDAIERDFGGPLFWQRLDGKRACRISMSVPGGWADEDTWPAAIEHAVEAMGRLYSTLGHRVEAKRPKK